ncbi:MAG: TlpA family protein disulfide reductase [Planctomycetales bacterium]|nr:TlpA family protein disulfide reductase [Planctomycetales bacterium]
MLLADESESTKNLGNANQPQLTIGDSAPHLNIDHWLGDDEGSPGEVEAFRPGTVYVVELWGTWCPPCIVEIPHLVKLQERYGPQKLRLVSVSSESVETVESFLASEVPGKDGLTYRQLTSDLWVAADPDRSVENDYLNATQLIGVPMAFLIGKSGHLEWAGHPGLIDKPLQAVIEDRWNSSLFAVKFRQGQKVLAAVRKISVLRQREAHRPEFVLEAIAKEQVELEGITHPQMRILDAFRLQMLVKLEHFNEVEALLLESLKAPELDAEAVGLLVSMFLQLTEDARIDRKRVAELALQRIKHATSSAELTSMPENMQQLARSQLLIMEIQLHQLAGRTQQAIVLAENMLQDADDPNFQLAIRQLLESLKK